MKWIAKVFEVAAVVFLSLMTVTVSIQVFSRFLGSPLVWSEELTKIFLLYGSFMGGALAYYKGKGFKITILVDAFPSKIRNFIELTVTALSIVLLTFVVYSVWLYISNTGQSATPLLDISHSLILVSMPIGYVLIIIRLVQDFRNLLMQKE